MGILDAPGLFSAPLHTASSRMEGAARSVASGDIEAGVIDMKVAAIEAKAGIALVKTADETLETLVDLFTR